MSGILRSVRLWGEMVKFSHSVFALPFAVTAAFLAGRNLEGRGFPHWGQLGLILICMIAARSTAMTFNRIVDAEIDARNPRTADRHLPTGRITRVQAWAMFALSAFTFGVSSLGFYLFYQNVWPILLSGPVLLYLCGYSFTKRFTRWSHLYLGTSLALSPPAAWLAVHPSSIGLPVLVLMVTVTCWVAGFDILYACQDVEVDRREGLHSLPSRLGPGPALWLARGAHAAAILGLIVLGVVADLNGVYAIGVVIACGLLSAQHALVRPGKYSQINLAFLPLNGLLSLVVGAAAISDILW